MMIPTAKFHSSPVEIVLTNLKVRSTQNVDVDVKTPNELVSVNSVARLHVLANTTRIVTCPEKGIKVQPAKAQKKVAPEITTGEPLVTRAMPPLIEMIQRQMTEMLELRKTKKIIPLRTKNILLNKLLRRPQMKPSKRKL